MVDFLGSGALNLDLVYEVDDLAKVRSAGFNLYPGREISGDHEKAEALMDFLHNCGTLMAKSGGGSAANTICALSRLGHKTGFMGVAGKDEAGAFILSSMKGVDCSLVNQVGRSAMCVVLIEKGAGNRAMFVAPHDHELKIPGSEILEYVSSVRTLHFSSLVRSHGISIQRELATALKAWQILSFDPGELYCAKGLEALSTILRRTDLLFITEEEVEMLTGKTSAAGLDAVYSLLHKREDGYNGLMGLSFFKESRGSAIICKQGPKGASIYSPQLSVTVSAEEVLEVVDNTGAGDAFNAGFLHALFQGGSAIECLRAGTRLAARCLSAFGRAWLEME